MNKKGAISDSDKVLFWTFFVLPTCIIIVSSMLYAAPRLIDAQTSISPTLQRHIYINTLISSPHCFAYTEPISGRTINGYVDLEKMTAQTLHNCLGLERRDEYGAFVQIFKETISDSPMKELETKNVLNRIGSKMIQHYKYVVIVDGEKEYDGVIRFMFY